MIGHVIDCSLKLDMRFERKTLPGLSQLCETCMYVHMYNMYEKWLYQMADGLLETEKNKEKIQPKN